MLLVCISFFIFVTLFFYSIFALPAEKKAHIQKRIQFYISNDSQSPMAETEMEEELSFSERMIKPAWKNIKSKYQKRLNKEKALKLEEKLLQAGQPFGFSPVGFKIFQQSLIVLLPLLGIGFALLLNLAPTMWIVILFLALGAAIIIPKRYLKMQSEKRNKAALKELPDTLDLLTISLEAGLGFDAALSKVVSKKEGTLSDEFKICLEEIRLGKTRKEALNGILHRLSLEELKALIYSIIQAEKLGVGMVSVLRVQTEDIREQRKQKAEEAAMKAPIKMLFPLVLFIFPTLFIILLGPAILQFMEAF